MKKIFINLIIVIMLLSCDFNKNSENNKKEDQNTNTNKDELKQDQNEKTKTSKIQTSASNSDSSKVKVIIDKSNPVTAKLISNHQNDETIILPQEQKDSTTRKKTIINMTNKIINSILSGSGNSDNRRSTKNEDYTSSYDIENISSNVIKDNSIGIQEEKNNSFTYSKDSYNFDEQWSLQIAKNKLNNSILLLFVKDKNTINIRTFKNNYDKYYLIIENDRFSNFEKTINNQSGSFKAISLFENKDLDIKVNKDSNNTDYVLLDMKKITNLKSENNSKGYNPDDLKNIKTSNVSFIIKKSELSEKIKKNKS